MMKKNTRDNPTYARWAAMIQRVTNPTNVRWEHYGGRGIDVCERWRDFDNFVADMGECPDGLTLDRLDNDGDYEPGNCRWATRTEQNRNNRRTHMITYDGRTQSMSAWAEEIGMNYKTLERRLNQYDFSVEDALTLPLMRGKSY